MVRKYNLLEKKIRSIVHNKVKKRPILPKHKFKFKTFVKRKEYWGKY